MGIQVEWERIGLSYRLSATYPNLPAASRACELMLTVLPEAFAPPSTAASPTLADDLVASDEMPEELPPEVEARAFADSDDAVPVPMSQAEAVER